MTPTLRLNRHLPLVLLLFSLTAPSRAEVVLDGSLGGSGGPLAGPDYAITGNLGTRRGANLFHSFSAFNLAAGESASFSGPEGINHVISRVTGQGASSIDGLIRSEIAGADLYLINPQGILFGPNARLDIPGSFFASTADYLKLGESGRYDASIPAASVLSTDPPAAFGFLSAAPAGIALHNSQLAVARGKELNLIAGEVTASGDGSSPLLAAPGGGINLIGSGAGEIVTDFSRLPDSLPTAGSIILTGTVDDGLQRIHVDAGDTLGSGGRVFISTGRFLLDHAGISSRSHGMEDGGDIVIAGSDVTVRSGTLKTATTGGGAAGSIRIKADTVHIGEDSQLSSASGLPFNPGFGGRAGDITLQATGPVQIDGTAKITSETAGNNNAGDIVIHAAEIRVSDESYLSTSVTTEYARGHAGDITLVAAGQASIDGEAYLFSKTPGLGNAGHITIDADNLHIGGESYLSTAAETPIFAAAPASGNAGDLTLRARNQLLIDGEAYIASITQGSGDAGDIRIEAGSFHATGNGFISSAAADEFPDTPVSGAAGSITLAARGQVLIDGPFRIRSNTLGSGNAGDIAISGDTIHLGGAGLITSSSASALRPYATGHAGNIRLQAAGDLLIDGSAKITSEAFDRGDAGSITLRAATFTLLGNGYVSTYTNYLANAGSIRIEAGSIRIGEEATVNSSAMDDVWHLGLTGNAGTVTLHGDALRIDGNGRVLSTTEGSGAAGTITLQGRTITLDHGEASTETGAGGAGGALQVSAGTFSLTHGGRLSAASTGSGGGVAGSIEISATDHLSLSGNSTIETATRDADGGDIRLTTNDYLSLKHSRITTSVQGGRGDGGNITVLGGSVALNHAAITANAYGGDGGNIAIKADPLIEDQSSAITASSVYGMQGVVGIDTPLVDLGGSLAELPEKLLADDLKPRNCTTTSATDYSFVVRDLAQPGRP